MTGKPRCTEIRNAFSTERLLEQGIDGGARLTKRHRL
ncbi:unnamed protein product, partial [Mycena citricolor]